MWLFAVGMSMAVICSVAGDFMVKQGSAEIKGSGIESFGGVKGVLNPIKLFQFIRQLGIFSNWKLWLGVVLLTFHFGGYLLAMRTAPVTVVVPLMSSTYLLNTMLGKFVLHERVSWLRWAGVAIVVCGITILVGFGRVSSG